MRKVNTKYFPIEKDVGDKVEFCKKKHELILKIRCFFHSCMV